MINRTLQRPMFRIGGSAGTGITSGLRPGYKRGRVVEPGGYSGEPDDIQDWNIENKTILTDTMNKGNAQKFPTDFEVMKEVIGDRPKGDPYPQASKYPYKASDFFMGLGSGILAQEGGQPIFQTIGKAAQLPLQNLSKTQMGDWEVSEQNKQNKWKVDRENELGQWESDKELMMEAFKNTSEDEKNKLWTEANAMFDNKGVNPYTKEVFRTPQEAYNLLLKQKFMSKEKVYTPEAQYNDSVNKYENKHLNNMNFKGNSVAARNLATHEANIVHGKYPEDLKDQFNLTQLWIDPTFFDSETMKLNEIGDVIPGIETGKVYLNTADGKMYKLGPDKVFIEVSLTDLQD